MMFGHYKVMLQYEGITLSVCEPEFQPFRVGINGQGHYFKELSNALRFMAARIEGQNV